MQQQSLFFDRLPIFFGWRKPTVPVHKLRISGRFDQGSLKTNTALPILQCCDEATGNGFILEVRLVADHKDLDLALRADLKEQHSGLWSPEALEPLEILVGEAIYEDLQPHRSNIYAVFLRGSRYQVEDYIVLSPLELYEVKGRHSRRKAA